MKKSMMAGVVCGLTAGLSLMACGDGASARPDGSLRIVQLDLARQMETTTFVSNYIDRVSSYGYNALELYLEGRVGTKTFSLPAGERYTPEEMKGLVAHAAEKGMIVIPVVSFLGHAEHFFKYPGLERFSESREGKYRIGSGHSTFCHSVPGAVDFFERYIADLCEIFTGPYFHAGFDEAWNSGLCSLCAPKEKRDELFTEEVLNIHRIIRKHGKRMMMWDDFFGFHPKALGQMPRDIVMMYWNYDTRISDRGARFNFAGRLREDALANYAKLGFDAIPCSWHDPDNMRSFILYARRCPTLGYLQTQWEDLIPNFHGGSLPGVLAVSMMLDDPAAAQAEDVFPKAVARLFPSLTAVEAQAVVRVLENASDPLAAQVLEASALARSLGPVASDPFDERALFDDILCRTRAAALQNRVRRAERILSDPRRNEGDVAAVKRLLESVPAEGLALATRRQAQFGAWRHGCSPCAVTNGPMQLVSKAEKFLAEAAVAAADECRLELELTLVDFYGCPWWRVEGLFSDGWRQIAKGAWKPAKGDWAAFCAGVTFRSPELPQQLRLSYHGFGDAQLRYVSVANRLARRLPSRILSTSGQVQDPENVLTDDYSPVTFGMTGFMKQFYDFDAMNAESVLTVALRDE